MLLPSCAMAVLIGMVPAKSFLSTPELRMWTRSKPASIACLGRNVIATRPMERVPHQSAT